MSEVESLTPLVKGKIESLRPKLLELTARNPLLNTRFSSRGASYIRVVDELPDVLAEKLSDGRMRLIPLPSLETDPKDERTELFQEHLANAILNDSEYLKQLELMAETNENHPQRQAEVERELKDRVRAQLGLPQRESYTNISLEQHAKNNHISPNYDLPLSDSIEVKAEHLDEDIQTLLLPDSLCRHLDKIISKSNESLQEMGVNILYAAFGFLEWTDSISSKKNPAPLLLLPLTIQKVITNKGNEYWISGNDEALELNPVLAEKFLKEFGVTLPPFNDEDSPESYFEAISEIQINRQPCLIRRQIAVGVFPSTTLAMYKDLDTSQLGENDFDLCEHPVIQDLFCSMGGSDSLKIFADDYYIDNPEIEAKVPLLITEADVSQFSVLVDLANEKNLSVEGPPGTGKSQTIVNAIATALNAGKKVLFVAEKAAALEVVKNRLEAFGIGDYILPLHSTRSSKQEVASSIRQRLALDTEKVPKEYDKHVELFKQTREDIQEYITFVTQQFENTEFNIYDVIWKNISTQSCLEKIPSNLLDYPIPQVGQYSSISIKSIRDLCDRYTNLLEQEGTGKPFWSYSFLLDADPMSVERVLLAAKDVGNAKNELNEKQKELSSINLPVELTLNELEQLTNAVNILGKIEKNNALLLAKRLSNKEDILAIKEFLSDAEEVQTLLDNLRKVLLSPKETTLNKLQQLETLITDTGLSSLQHEAQDTLISKVKHKAKMYQQAVDFFEKLNSLELSVTNFSLQQSKRLCLLTSKVPPECFSLRQTSLFSSGVLKKVQKSAQDADTLKKQRSVLEDTFILRSLPEKADILNLISRLTSPGIFSFLNSDYKAAKRSYLTIVKHPWVNNQQAVKELQDLIEWQFSVEDFDSKTPAKEPLGSHFVGIDTPFAAFLELLNYLQSIETEFSSVVLLEAIQQAKASTLVDLSKLAELIESEDPVLDFLDAQSTSKTLEQLKPQLKALEANIETIRELSQLLITPDTIDVTSIPQIVLQFSNYVQECEKLASNSKAQAILGESYTDYRANNEDIILALEISELSCALEEKLSPLLLNVLEHNHTSALRVISEGLCCKTTEYDELLNTLLKKAQVNPDNVSAFKDLFSSSQDFFDAADDRTGLEYFRKKAFLVDEFSQYNFQFIVNSIDMLCDTSSSLADIAEALIYRGMFKKICETSGNFVTRFSGERMSSLRHRLADTDRSLVKLSRLKLRDKLNVSANPPAGISKGKKADYTELALLKNEALKKSKHIPVRTLTRRASKALLELKPCWMMSPLTVAQYIPKGTLEFDLVIIDEASQMTPENAIGAIARAKQVMVVGDTNQLPPTNFFGKMFNLDDTLDEEDEVLDESILEMANKVFLPARRLNWHYRSKHESLISFSNTYVYDSQLVVFPSTTANSPLNGVSQVYVAGEYHSSTNRIEAKAMIHATLQFIKSNPELSLGLVVMNQKQRELLEQEWSYILSQDTDAKRYEEYWLTHNGGLERLFIKNLENVQGDQRDVIFIGTVYGPETSGGPVPQRFGPINGSAGKRRLNVLFSRAKQQIVTFTSMKASDILADEQKPGAFMLKKWLEYTANLGQLSIGDTTLRKPDSDFEVFVCKTLERLGCIAIPQVGVSGYFIDIGVKHPHWENDFLFGIECDGASYHSSKSARDRDRLRQEVLESKGWYLHRIWSTDWFADPRGEEQKLKTVIEKLLLEKTYAAESAQDFVFEQQLT